jgi:two-component system, LytTR family, sensor kinase
MNLPAALSMSRYQRPPLGAGIVVASILGFWLFYVVIVTLRATVMDFPSQGELAYRRAIVTVLGILVTVILWIIIRGFDRKSLMTRIIATVIAAIPCAVVIAVINYYFFNVFDAASLFDDESIRTGDAVAMAYQEVAELAISRYFFLIAWAALYLAMSYARDVRDSERRTALFAQAAQQAELRALRYQVNPHFLFNTLNALSSLVMSDRKHEAETMIMNLSAFFRTSLTGDPSADVTLGDEIALQKLYLEMEAVRFPNRLTTKIDLPDSLREAAVPGLILQPLVENAIKHGVAKTSQFVTLQIAASQLGDDLIVEIINDGVPTQAPTANELGIGLTNVRDRLAARFGDKANISLLAPSTGGFCVRLVMPKTVRVV